MNEVGVKVPIGAEARGEANGSPGMPRRLEAELNRVLD